MQHAGEIGFRPGQAGHDARADRVGDVDENDRERLRLPLQGAGCSRRLCEQNVGLQGDKLFGKSGNALAARRCGTYIDVEIAPFPPTAPFESLTKCGEPRLGFRVFVGKRQQDADAPHALGLLRMRGEWRERGRAAKKCDELASSHNHALL